MNNPALTKDEKTALLTPAMFTARVGSFPDIYGRLWWDRPAITITRECGHVGNGRYSHPEQDRLVTVREMALLQGFPPDYQFHGPLSAKYNQIGDAVPPMISELLAEHIIAIEDRTLRLPQARQRSEQYDMGWPQTLPPEALQSAVN
jgi:DNA (cytosine-5)-methyltransferase 1